MTTNTDSIILTENTERPITENEIVTMENIMDTFHEHVLNHTKPLVRHTPSKGA